MTAPKHGNRPDSQVQRARGGSPQRIFLSSGTIVDRPPVLFRMPSVAPSDAPHESLTDDSLSDTPIDAAAEQQLPETTATSVRTPAADEQIVMVDPPAMVVQQPHAPQAPQAPDTKPLSPQAAVTSPQAESAPLQRRDPAEPRHQTTPAADRNFSAREESGSTPAPTSAGPAAENRKEQSRREEPRRDSAKPRAVETSPPAVPAGRSWMESYGSRLIPVLLIVAVAAYALLVNNGAESEPEMTLADFEINPGETLDADAAVASANNPLAVPANKQTSGNQNSAEKSGNIALTPPANDPQAATWSDNSEISEVKPDFDLAELMGSPAAAEMPTPPVTVPTPDVNQQPDWQRELAAAGEAAGIREPEASVTDFNDGVIREGREGIAAGNAAAATGQPDSSPIRDNQWVKLDRRDQAAPSKQQLADAMRQQEAYRPNSEPPAMRAEDAIQAAVDAAVSGQFTTPGESPAAPSYRMSNQPAGIPDWSRYLPPPQNSSNSSSLIQGMQPNDANPAAVPPEYPGQYPGQYPGSAYGSPGVPQQAYGMPTGYPQQPPATR